MLKRILKPIQDRLIKKNLCPGCTTPLKSAKEIKEITERKKIVQCKCKRIFVWDMETDTYKRATKDEEQHFLTK